MQIFNFFPKNKENSSSKNLGYIEGVYNTDEGLIEIDRTFSKNGRESDGFIMPVCYKKKEEVKIDTIEIYENFYGYLNGNIDWFYDQNRRYFSDEVAHFKCYPNSEMAFLEGNPTPHLDAILKWHKTRFIKEKLSFIKKILLPERIKELKKMGKNLCVVVNYALLVQNQIPREVAIKAKKYFTWGHLGNIIPQVKFEGNLKRLSAKAERILITSLKDAKVNFYSDTRKLSSSSFNLS